MGFTQFARKLVIFVFDSYFLVFLQQRFVCDPRIECIGTQYADTAVPLGLDVLVASLGVHVGLCMICAAYNCYIPVRSMVPAVCR